MNVEEKRRKKFSTLPLFLLPLIYHNKTHATIRQVGNLFSQQAKSGDAAVVVIGARYTLELSKERVWCAIRGMISQQPLLRAQIYSKDQLGLIKSEELDLDSTVLFEEESFDNLLTNLRIPYGHDSLPLWRAYVLGSHTLLWAFDHSVFDGKTGTLFHRMFATWLREEGTLEGIDSQPLAPPLEQLYNVKPPIWQKLTKLFEPSKGKVFAGSSRTPLGIDKTATQFFTLSSDRFAAVRQRSKDLSVTITAVLYAALAQAVISVEASNILLSGDLTIKADMPVDGRRFIAKQGSADMWGFFVLFFENWLTLTADEVRQCKDPQELNSQWAQQFNGRLMEQMNKHPTPLGWPIGGLNPQTTERLLGHVKQTGKRVSTVEVSNLGALDESEQEGVEEVWFAQGCNTLGSLYTLSVFGIKHGSTSFVLSAPNTCPVSSVVSRFQHIIESL